ncbi:unnamed protein product [Lymnaea stagnalis]|uniref:F-box domain-containing protein n=1 Tax=Lymnaea stagnalis TaxID=6523 RepID=A0AAV2HLH8_LYMST
MNKKENQRKKLRTSKTRTKSTTGRDNTKAKKPEPPPWSQLPATVLTGIYKYLGDVDRVSMARVCRPWEQGFNYPALWRTRIIHFRKYRDKLEVKRVASYKSKTAVPVSSGKCAIRFAKRFPNYLQKVDIDFNGVMSLMSISREVVQDFMKFVELLHDAKLTKLRIHLSGLKITNVESREHLINAVNRLIKNQHNLKKFEISLAYFDLHTGIRLLKCLAEASGKSLETLFLFTLFNADLAVYREEDVFTELQKFKNLSSICVDYSILSDELVTLWSKGCPSLSSMRLWAFSESHAISNEAWQALVWTHPRLLVQFHVEINLDTITLPLLSPAIPLYKLRLHAVYRLHSEFELTSLLHRVAIYHRTITSIEVEIYGEFENIDTVALLSILSNCSKLPPLSFKESRHFSKFWTLS